MEMKNLPMNTTIACTASLCGTTADKATQTISFVDFIKEFPEPHTYPTTGIEQQCWESYKNLYARAVDKIENLETLLQNAKLAHHNDYLGMVRKLAEEYEARLSTERMKHFKLEEEYEKLNFKYRKLVLDNEKFKVILKTNLNV